MLNVKKLNTLKKTALSKYHYCISAVCIETKHVELFWEESTGNIL